MASDVQPFEFLWVVVESAYGTPKVTPVAGTDSIYIRLAGGNRFTMRPKPTMRTVQFGGGFAADAYRVSDQSVAAGDLTLELCYSQAKILLDWATTRINGGQTTPWTTTEPPGDLASCSVYHGIMRDDGTIKRRQYQGTKVTGYSLQSSSESGLTTLKLNLRAQRAAAVDPTSGAFAAPADTAFPVDPILFYQLAAGLLVGGSAVAFPNGLNLNVTNSMTNKYFAGQFLAFDRLRGRKAEAELDVLYTASPNWRADYEALTTRALAVSWTNGTNTVALDLKGNCILDDVTDDLTPGKVYDQKLKYTSQWDTSASSIVSFTYT